MLCQDCIKRSTLDNSGIIQFCYTHTHAKEMRQLLEDFSRIMDDGRLGQVIWYDLTGLQTKVDKILEA